MRHAGGEQACRAIEGGPRWSKGGKTQAPPRSSARAAVMGLPAAAARPRHTGPSTSPFWRTITGEERRQAGERATWAGSVVAMTRGGRTRHSLAGRSVRSACRVAGVAATRALLNAQGVDGDEDLALLGAGDARTAGAGAGRMHRGRRCVFPRSSQARPTRRPAPGRSAEAEQDDRKAAPGPCGLAAAGGGDGRA